MLKAGDVKPGATVLVCSDERHIVRLIRVNLERQGHRVLTASDGNQALQILGTEHVNLLAIDGGLTSPTTTEFIDRLRQLPDGEKVQVIILRSPFDSDPQDGPQDGPNSGLPPGVVNRTFSPAETTQIFKPKKA